jgi:hypothetical protein
MPIRSMENQEFWCLPRTIMAMAKKDESIAAGASAASRSSNDGGRVDPYSNVV